MADVVIVGGGFGGLAAARALKGAAVNVTLVDRHNHHLFQPLLYQVATAALNPSDIATPVRSILRRHHNTRVVLDRVMAVDVAAKLLQLEYGQLRYDFLILATGAMHSYSGHPEWAAHAPGLKTLDDALEIRRRIFLAYEAAERENDPQKQCQWMTFVIVGGGPTGVELAGALAEIARHTLERDFRSIDPKMSRVVLVEGSKRVLSAYPESLSEKARRKLMRIGVEVRTSTHVTAVDAEGAMIGAERLPAHTVIWAAGVMASPLGSSLGIPTDRAGRVPVDSTLAIPGHDDVFVVGDLAALEQDGRLIPGVSPAAIQEGRHAAANIQRALRGEPLAPFHYRDKGSFAVIGRGAAVGRLPAHIQLSGPLAWFAWLFIHIAYLIGYRSRALVLIQWAYSYLTYRRGARLITGETIPALPRLELAKDRKG